MRVLSQVPAVTLAASLTCGLALSCSERHTDEQCYFDDSEDADKYFAGPMAWRDWCDYGPDEVSPLVDEYCPAGECVDTFITCDEVPVSQECQACPTEELDHKVLVALGARYEDKCPGMPQDLIDFERGCMFERGPIPSQPELKRCCYTAVVVGECSLR